MPNFKTLASMVWEENEVTVVMGLGQKFLTRDGSGIYCLGLILENFP